MARFFVSALFLLGPMAAFCQGLSVGNFGIAAESSNGQIFSRIMVNPAELGPWLEDLGSSSLSFSINGTEIADSSIKWNTLARDFPEFRLATSDPALKGIEVQVRAFAPIGVGAEKSSKGFLPVIALEITLRNTASKSIALETRLSLAPRPAAVATSQTIKTDKGPVTLASMGRTFLAVRSPASLANMKDSARLSVRTTLRKGVTQQLNFYLGAFDSRGAYTHAYGNLAKLIQGLANGEEELERDHSEFVKLMPRTGDGDLDRAIRWYAAAGILLTRGTRNEVLTMGYREFNQRDSFWTTWIHLYFWPDLERQMIRETIAAQKPSGQIPTTILPLIETDAIDITEYFVLRTFRYHNWYRDDAFLVEAWPSIKKAISYLKSRDVEQIGLPQQGTYWADWKDVPGVEGRAYAPHFALLWLAVLDGAAKAARHLGKSEEALAFEADHQKASSVIHRDLWNGRHYVDRWKDGKTSGVVLLDQVAGIFFDAVPPKNIASIYEALRANETPWGVRETFPYMKEPFGQPHGGGGNYHNGGIWPWWCFVHATGLYVHGRATDAERIVKNVARADLGQDWTPNEFLNGDDGSNHGFPIQAWNAAIFATMYRGALGLERVSPDKLRISPRIPGRDFDTWVVLPGGAIRIKRTAGELSQVEGPANLPYQVVLDTDS